MTYPMNRMQDALVGMSEARKMLGVSHNTMLKIFEREQVKSSVDPLDSRRKYVRRADVERIKAAGLAVRSLLEDTNLTVRDKAA